MPTLTGHTSLSWLVAQLGQQLAARVPALRELDSVGAILAMPRLRAEGEMRRVGITNLAGHIE